MSEISNYTFPGDRYYDREHHLWTHPLPDIGRVRVGMDALGLESLGDLVFIAFKPVGTLVRRGESLGTMEASKMTGDLIAPVSGVVKAHNPAVVADPHLANRAPYSDGWLVEIEPVDWNSDATRLVHGAEVRDWATGEVERYRTQGWID